MIREFKKKKTPVDLYEFPGYLEGHCFAYGRLGSGKSVSLMSVVQYYHDVHGYKIIDAYGGERSEGNYWTIPSQDINYWMNIGKLGKFDEEGPKQYRVNLLYPYFKSKLPKKLPKKKGYVNSKVFTIPMMSLTPEDVSVVIGSPSETSKYELNELLRKITKKTNSGSILEILDSKSMKNLKNTLFYKNFFLPLIREQFLMDNYCDYNLDVVGEMRDKDAITVICLDFVPKEFHLFILNYFFRNVNDLLDMNKISKKNIIFLREASTFFRATDDSVLDDRYKIFRTLLSMYLRMGRRGTYYFCDCQSPSETRGIVSDSNDLLFCFRMSSFKDKEEAFGEAKREKRVRNDQLSNLAFLEKGQCLVLPTGKNAKTIQIAKPRTEHWKKEYGNFLKTLWDRFEGEWMSTEIIKDYIEEKCKPVNTVNVPKKEAIINQGVEASSTKTPSFEEDRPLLGETIPIPEDMEDQPTDIIITEEKPKKKKKEKTENDIKLENAFKTMMAMRQ